MKFQIIGREGLIEKMKYLQEIFEQEPESRCGGEKGGYLEE